MTSFLIDETTRQVLVTQVGGRSDGFESRFQRKAVIIIGVAPFTSG